MHLSVVTPENVLFQGEASIVRLPGEAGRFEILQCHAPLLSTLTAGRVSATVPEAEDFEIDIEGGFVEVSNGDISLCIIAAPKHP